MDRKIEGYWYSEYTPEYPLPEANVLSEKQAIEIYNLILEKQKRAKELRYRGFSSSRITKEILGSSEYQTDKWIWPCDFAPHYVLKHKVKPTDAFLDYIGYDREVSHTTIKKMDARL